MAFLDNSGDIILDAVLTDAGRQRMAQGKFNIVKFALGDEEINYGLYNSSHPSGSAFNDLEIMQTPILEAFTNNTSMMKSKLMTITNPNHLYLPILKLNETQNAVENMDFHKRSNTGTSTDVFCVAVNQTTVTNLTNNAKLPQGAMHGPTQVNPRINNDSFVLIDQGKETAGEERVDDRLVQEMLETQYVIQMDHRLGRLCSVADNAIQDYSFVDDDDIATYYFGIGEGNGIVQLTDYFNDVRGQDLENRIADASSYTPFNGPLGTNVRFKIRSSALLRQSDLLFTEIGGTGATIVKADAGGTVSGLKYIDSIVRVTGVTTGYSIDIPIRYLKS